MPTRYRDRPSPPDSAIPPTPAALLPSPTCLPLCPPHPLANASTSAQLPAARPRPHSIRRSFPPLRTERLSGGGVRTEHVLAAGGYVQYNTLQPQLEAARGKAAREEAERPADLSCLDSGYFLSPPLPA